ISIAPANKASIAEGPALKLFHSTLTCGPIAFSNHPLLLPTIACGCVMLGNAPTRITLCALAKVPRKINNPTQTKRLRLVMAHSPRRCRQHIGLGFLFLAGFRVGGLSVDGFRMRVFRGSTADQVGQRRILQNLCSRIPHFQENFVQRAVVRIAIDQKPQLVRIAERRKRPVNQTDDSAQVDLRRRPAQPVSTLDATRAFPRCARSSVPGESVPEIFPADSLRRQCRESGLHPGYSAGSAPSSPATHTGLFEKSSSWLRSKYPYVTNRHYRKSKRIAKSPNFAASDGCVISAS